MADPIRTYLGCGRAAWLGGLSASALILATQACAGKAHAQSAQADPRPSAGAASGAAAASPGQSSGVTGLAEIVVTAQRRSENVQKTPLAIEAISASAIAAADVTTPTELSRLVPAAQFSASASPFPLLYIRGVGSNTGTSFNDPAVTVSYDGVPFARPYQGLGQYYDLERVEVLIGPQGTLYGRNATGGAINIIPAKPRLGAQSLDFGLEYGNYNTVKVNSAANIPVSDDAALRVAFQVNRNDGYYSETAGAVENEAGRIQLRYDPTSRLTINLGFDFFHNGGTATNGVVDVGNTVLAIPAAPPNPAGPGHVVTLTLPTAGFPAADKISLSDPRLIPAFTATGLRPPTPGQDNANNTFYGLQATINYTTDFGVLTVIPAYRHGSLDFLSYGSGFGLGVQELDDQESFEARFASPETERLRWIVGGFFLHDLVKPHMLIDTFSPAFLGITVENRFTVDTRSFAPFADATLRITDTVRLIAGVRYTQDTKKPTGQLVASNSPVPVSLTGTPSKTYSDVTYRGGVQWDPTPTSMVYATYSTGWHSGGFFFTHDNPTYQPEQLFAATLGTKNRFFDNRLQANLELFSWRYLNEQTSFVANDSQGTADFVTENVGRSTRQGFDADLQYKPTQTTTLAAQTEYLVAKYQKFQYDVPSAFPTNEGCPVSYTKPGFLTVNCTGTRVPYSPTWTVNGTAQQDFPLPDGANISALGRAHYQSLIDTGNQNVPIELQKAYVDLDLLLSYTAPAGRWTVSLYANNVTDQVVKTQTFQSTASGILGDQQAIYFSTLRPPRTFGVRFSAHL